ncbi:MAG: hypothetical protein NTZ68_00465 [Candidatus Dependentiae bacterium]|nr:hypothetical protein [Candidatus Dependentiae bacterium]
MNKKIKSYQLCSVLCALLTAQSMSAVMHDPIIKQQHGDPQDVAAQDVATQQIEGQSAEVKSEIIAEQLVAQEPARVHVQATPTLENEPAASDIKSETMTTSQKNILIQAAAAISSWWAKLSKKAQNSALSLKIQHALKSNGLANQIKDSFNNRSAKSILNTHGQGIRNPSQAQALARHMSHLGTKEKQNALNEHWAPVRSKKLHDETKAIESETSLTPEQTQEKVDSAKEKFQADVTEIQNVMKPALKPNEVLTASPDNSDNQIFEMVDMSKIDPTQPLTEQYDALEKSGHVKMAEKALAQAVTEFYGNKVHLNFDKPVTEQILTAIPDWSNFDGQLQINILSTLTAQIPKEFLSSETIQQLDKEQEELRKKDEAHAQELRKQLAKDKAALKAAKDTKKAAALQAKEEADLEAIKAQEQQLAKDMEKQLVVEQQAAQPEKVTPKKGAKKTGKKHKKQGKKEVVVAAVAPVEAIE